METECIGTWEFLSNASVETYFGVSIFGVEGIVGNAWLAPILRKNPNYSKLNLLLFWFLYRGFGHS
ncbi:hypothetical protein VDG1235_2776 [Verrucomicrobiia bacterium DG1235]|nr:hypothetical protein VDG1235_2776 [Verrucomicrobiae bacterium DG1235]